jgi:hypothetical protein
MAVSYILVLSLIISAIAKSEQDTIAYTPTKAIFHNSWWLSKEYNFYFWLKIPFSFFQNGWHFCDAIRTFFLLLPICLLLHNWWYVFPAYLIYGLFFELFFKY